MANTIGNFLVGIGFDFDKKGADQVDSSIDGIKSRALQLGTVVAGAFGIKALTADFAASNDMLGKFAQTLNVSANDVNAFGNAIQHEGGTLESFMGQLQGIEQLRAGLLQGDAEFIALAGRAQIDTTELIEAENATEAYLSLADQFQKLNSQQRLNAAKALGLDEASIRLLSKGRDEVSNIIEEQKRLRPVTEQMTKTAADFNDETQILGNNIGRMADQISTALLPEVNSIIAGTNEWFSANQGVIDQNLGSFLEPVKENFAEIAGAGALFAGSGILASFAGLAKFVPIIGTGLATIAGGLATITGVGAAGAAGYAVGSVINEQLDDTTKDHIGRTTARVLAFFGNDDAQRSLDLEKQQLAARGEEQPGVPIWDWDREDVQENLGVDLPDWMFQPVGDLLGGDDQEPVEVEAASDQEVSPLALERQMDDQANELERQMFGMDPFSQTGTDDVELSSSFLARASAQDSNIAAMGSFDAQGMMADATSGFSDQVDAVASQGGTSQQQITVNMNLDGRIIDQKIVEVTERNNQLALDDLSSNVGA